MTKEEERKEILHDTQQNVPHFPILMLYKNSYTGYKFLIQTELMEAAFMMKTTRKKHLHKVLATI